MPSLFAVISPSEETEIIVSSEDAQATVLSVVFSGVNSHSKVFVSSSRISVSLFARLMLSAITSFTVIVNLFDVPLEVFAVIVAVPTPTAVRVPVLLTTKILVSELSQVILLSSAFEGYTDASRLAVSPAFILDGTFFADKTKTKSEQKLELKNKVYNAMNKRSNKSNYEYIKYIKQGEADD